MASTTELVCGVVVKTDATFGASAFASKKFATGDIILCEEPMLRMLGSDAAACDPRGGTVVKGFGDVLSASRVPPSFFDAIMSIVLSPATVGDVLRLEASLFSPSCALQSKAERQAITLLLLSDEMFTQCFPTDCASVQFWRQCKEFKEKGVARVQKLIHACRVNVHEVFGRGFLFDKASKFAHSCNANTFWMMHMEPTPRVVHIALRPIDEGELLSFSYIGSGLNLLLPALHRLEALSDLSFTCRCSRCVAAAPIDTSRSLKCPHCNAFSLRLDVTRGEWSCMECDAVYFKEDALSRILFDERAIGTAVMHLFFGRGSDDHDGHKLWESVEDSTVTREIAAAKNPLLQRWLACCCAGDALGFDHYLFACAFSGLMISLVRGIEAEALVPPSSDTQGDLRKLLEHLRASPGDPWVSTLKRWYVRATNWFRQNVPGGAQEARVLLLFAEVVDGLLAQLLLTVEEHSDLDSFRAMLHDRSEHPMQRFGVLLQYPDFAVSKKA